jgi:DNA-binding transcriptional ArsR family regulator
MDILQRLFKSVSGKTRLEILLLLLKEGELTVKEIALLLNRQMNTISQNLRILEKDNFVKFRHTSTNTYYSIKRDDKYQYNKDILRILKKRLKEIKSQKSQDQKSKKRKTKEKQKAK